MVKHILLFTRYFAPVYEASGPIQSVLGMVHALSNEYRFSVVTSAYDPRKQKTYGEVEADRWVDYKGMRIFYASHGKRGPRHVRARIRETNPDMMYSQSFFDPLFTGLPLALVRFGVVSKIPRLVAPRGELNAGALAISSKRKILYRALMRHVLMGDDVNVHTTSAEEQKTTMQMLDLGQKRVHVANNIKPMQPVQTPPPAKAPGSARFAFLGRLAPIKNLHLALQFLTGLKGDIAFDIYGPLDNDTAYWERCQKMIATMPSNITVQYHGAVDPSAVGEQLTSAHFFLLPTAGENFGHAILEALNAGLPSIISDQTPHLHDAPEAGWAICLHKTQAWRNAINACIAMDAEEYAVRRTAAMAYAQHYQSSCTSIGDHKKMFDAVLAS